MGVPSVDALRASSHGSQSSMGVPSVDALRASSHGTGLVVNKRIVIVSVTA